MNAHAVTRTGLPGAEAAQRLETLLGDPRQADNPYGFAAAVARDERDAYPEQLTAALRETGFHLNYVPAEWGGAFRSFYDSMILVRTAARRDLNVMPATMFSITAATCLILHGSAEQQQQAARILARGGAVGFALSEAEHGSDLLANTARLEPAADGGWLLSGEKWLVGRGASAEAVYVVARTGERGPGAFSAVLLDLTASNSEQPDSERLRRDTAVRAGGMRGIDFAHFTFDALPVPASALVGRTGEALESAVKAQQVIRVMSMAGSLGCADTALRLTLDFATTRTIGRAALIDAPYPRRELAAASAAVIAADVAALAAVRGIHVAPEVFSVWGCAAKHVVAEATADLMTHCGTVLATRSVLRTEGPGGGMYQKLLRDSALCRVVDTSTVANLRSYTGQLPALASALAPSPDRPTPSGDAAALRTVFRLDEPLPAYEPLRLDLNARGKDPATAGLAAVAEEAGKELAEAGADDAAALVGRLADAISGLDREIAAARASAAKDNALVDLAERFAWLHAAACAVHLWWANRDTALYGAEPGASGWLEGALAYLLAKADGTDPRRAAGPELEPALDAVAALHAADRLFSAVPVQLARPGEPPARPGDRS